MGMLQSPLGGLIIAAVGFTLLALILVWGLSPRHEDRRAHLFAALVSGRVVFALNMVARATGVWQWYGYQLPLAVQLGMLFALPAALFAAVLAGYRRLVARTRRPTLAYGLIGLLLLVPVTIGGDLYSMRQGTLSFGRGYTIWHDIIVGQGLFWLPVLLYAQFRRIRPSAATDRGRTPISGAGLPRLLQPSGEVHMEEKGPSRTANTARYAGLGVALGAGVGAAIGVATGNLEVWLAVGVAVGASIGLVVSKGAGRPGGS